MAKTFRKQTAHQLIKNGRMEHDGFYVDNEITIHCDDDKVAVCENGNLLTRLDCSEEDYDKLTLIINN